MQLLFFFIYWEAHKVLSLCRYVEIGFVAECWVVVLGVVQTQHVDPLMVNYLLLPNNTLWQVYKVLFFEEKQLHPVTFDDLRQLSQNGSVQCQQTVSCGDLLLDSF